MKDWLGKLFGKGRTSRAQRTTRSEGGGDVSPVRSREMPSQLGQDIEKGKNSSNERCRAWFQRQPKEALETCNKEIGLYNIQSAMERRKEPCAEWISKQSAEDLSKLSGSKFSWINIGLNSENPEIVKSFSTKTAGELSQHDAYHLEEMSQGNDLYAHWKVIIDS